MKSSLVYLLALVLVACEKQEETKRQSILNEQKTKIVRKTSDRLPSGEKAIKRINYHNDRFAKLSRKALEEFLSDKWKIRYAAEASHDFELAIAELAARDPQAAIAYFVPSEMRVDEPGFFAVAIILAETEPETLKKWLMQDWINVSYSVKMNCQSRAFDALGSVDPPSALDFYLKGDFKSLSSDAMNAIFLPYGKKDPREAAAAAKKYLKGSNLDKALFNCAAGAMKTDPKLALEIASEIKNSGSFGFIIGATLSSWIDSNPVEALMQIKTLSSTQLQKILASNVSTDPENSIVIKLARSQPDELIGMLSNLAVSDSSNDIFRTAVQGLSSTHPEKVFTLLDSIQEGDMKNNLVRTQFFTLARNDLMSAVGQVSNLADDASRVEAYRAIGEATGGEKFDSISVLVRSLPVSYKESFYAAAIVPMANEDPKKAASILADQNTTINMQDRNRLIAVVASKLLDSDPAYADQWMNHLPEDQQPSAMEGIARTLANNDILGLAEKLTQLPKDRKWASGVKVLIENTRAGDPEMSNKWQAALDAAQIK